MHTGQDAPGEFYLTTCCYVLPHSVILVQSGSKNENQHESTTKQYGDFEFKLRSLDIH